MSQIVPIVCLPPSDSVLQKLPHPADTNSISQEVSSKIRRTEPSEFGSFQKLPTELRFNIWQYLMPEHRDEPECAREPYGSWTTKAPRHGNRLAILRTSRALQTEVEGELYRSRALRISIKPGRKGWRAEDLPGSDTIDFTNTNFSRFASIEVEIHCPERRDPGQLLYARAAVIDLVCALKGLGADIQHGEPYSMGVNFHKIEHEKLVGKGGPRIAGSDPDVKIPKVQITFLNTEKDTWNIESSIRSTFGVFHDLDLLLAPFGYLFNVRQIEFNFPEVLSNVFRRYYGLSITGFEARSDPTARFVCLCRYVRRQVLSSHQFELDSIGPTRSFFEADIKRYLFLDKSIDTASGPTAAILRRERLIHNQWYRRTVERILEKHRQRTGDDDYVEVTEIRYRDFKRLDPSYQDHGRKLHVTYDPNWLEEWRRYWPTGIPPKGSQEWHACIAAARR